MSWSQWGGWDDGLTCPHNFNRRVRVELPGEPLPTNLADRAIRARAFSIRGVHRFCAPDSLPAGQSFSNTARWSSRRRFSRFEGNHVNHIAGKHLHSRLLRALTSMPAHL